MNYLILRSNHNLVLKAYNSSSFSYIMIIIFNFDDDGVLRQQIV